MKIRKFVCPNCGKTYASNQNLKKHTQRTQCQPMEKNKATKRKREEEQEEEEV